jgi:site-specific DNA-methyltransferase (adenine-specific)
MGIYYQDDFVTLYHGDCLTEHREWLDADVLVTDPPYGVAYESNMQRNKKRAKQGRPVANDKSAEARDAVLSIWGERPSITFGRWDIPRPERTHTRLIWDKGNTVGMGDLSIPWGRSEEEIYIAGKGFVGKREGNVLRAQMLMNNNPDRLGHPTPKPVGLMEVLIGKCPPGVVSDPFAGSGATLAAAKNLGRKAVGIELEERYCETIAKRLSQDLLELEWTA